MTEYVEYLPALPDGQPRAPRVMGFLDNPHQPLLAWTGKLGAGFSVEAHAHPRAQLTLCYEGLMRLEAGADTWFIPARHGIWIPPGVTHELSAQAQVEVHHLYVHPRFAARTGLPGHPVVVRASPLLRGVANRLARVTQRDAHGALMGGWPEVAGASGPASPLSPAPPLTPAQARRLAWVAIDEMARLETPDLRLPGARDPRLTAAMHHLIAHPADRHGLEGAADVAGTSARTLARLFGAETGLSFRDWRMRMRFLLALEGLEMGEGSTALAARLGYSTPSAFSAAFHRHFGAPPSAFRKVH